MLIQRAGRAIATVHLRFAIGFKHATEMVVLQRGACASSLRMRGFLLSRWGERFARIPHYFVVLLRTVCRVATRLTN